MKNVMLSSAVVAFALASCSTVSSILQNTFPYNASVLVAAGSPANTSLSTVAVAQSINQITGAGANVRNIRASNATLSVNSNTSIGIFKSVKVYLSNNGSNEVLVASRENIPDNVGSTLALDLNSSSSLDHIFKSGLVQQRIVYVLKQSPTSDVTLKSSVGFSSEPVTNP